MTSTGPDLERLVRIEREKAVRSVAIAARDVTDFAAVFLEAVERRMGIADADGDERAMEDPAYRQIVDVLRDLGVMKIRLAQVAIGVR